MASPDLPTKFPCWVKAIYSWGGETKKDLGFVEGDLIECLNAGDGSWWMGRLRRDRRMVGLFPSNFVKVLDQDFSIPSRQVSPMPLRNDSSGSRPSPPVTPSPKKSKSVFRKPFSAHYAAESPHAQPGSGTPSPTSSVSKTWKPRPYSSMRTAKDTPTPPKVTAVRPQSPTIPRPVPRASGSARSRHAAPISRAVSPLPQTYSYNDINDDPYQQQEQEQMDSSPPPPPPPTHRVIYTRPGTPCEDYTEPQRRENVDYNRPIRTPSPAISHSGHTPSPLRDAMNDVMTSLDGMSTAQNSQEQRPQSPVDIWSPEAFDEVYNMAARSTRPHSSLGIGRPDALAHDDEDTEDSIQDSSALYESQPSRAQEIASHGNAANMHYRSEPARHTPRSTYNKDQSSSPPDPPPKNAPYEPASSSVYSSFSRPESSHGQHTSPSRPGSSRGNGIFGLGRMPSRRLKSQKSAVELGSKFGRTMTLKSSTTESSSTAPSTVTNSTNSTQLTSQSLMSGASAGAFSATSAGSYARRRFTRNGSTKERPKSMLEHRSDAVPSEVSYNSAHDSRPGIGPRKESDGSGEGVFGGLSEPTMKKRGFFKKMLDTAKTSAANARSTISTGSSSRPGSRDRSAIPDGITAISGGTPLSSPSKNISRSGSVDWMQMRRDTNRSNSLSGNERTERSERCQMLDIAVINPADILAETVEGDESADGYAVGDPTDFTAANLQLVDKSARFVSNLPATITPISLAQGYLCRPYRGDVQKLRAIFTWVAERLSWEDDFEGQPDTRRLIMSRRGCSEEISYVVYEMCAAVGIQAEVIRGHLKDAREIVSAQDLNEVAARPNHWWNGVNVDGEWRIMDCSLANPTNPRRIEFSSVGSQAADGFWFLTRPMEICYTHVPLLPEQQHLVPSLPHDVLMALPVASPPFFKNKMQMSSFDTSLLYLEGLEMAHIHFTVPEEVECVAEVEARAFASDADGDFFESGDMVTKRALAQAEFIKTSIAGLDPGNVLKRYTVKAVLPSQADSSSEAVLKIYAGRRGLMHGITKNPHPLALTIPLQHQGQNPDYEFFTRHPTPHALKHEIYVVGPQCRRLALNSTFVFCVRQHPAAPVSAAAVSGTEKRPGSPSIYGRAASALSIQRPGSAMSMASISASGSNYSNPSATGSESSNGSSSSGGSQGDIKKPAKLAIQSPSGKIIRMTRKPDQRTIGGEEDGVEKAGTSWETFIKVGERGIWRGLVLADRSARWCVFGEWECV